MRVPSDFVTTVLVVAFAAAGAARLSPARADPPAPGTVTLDAPSETGDPRAADSARRWFGTPVGKSKRYVCFERTYDAAHLARHPQQRVGSMTLLVRGEAIPEDPAPNYSFALRMAYRGASARFASTGYCGHAGSGSQLRCGVDCDGGSLDVALSSDTSSGLVSLERIAIWPEAGGADEDKRAALDAGADDKAFRLHRVALPRCAHMGNEDDAAEIRPRK